MSLQDNIARIEVLRKELDALLPMTDENKRKYDEKVRLEFHYNTNHIEGNTLTYGETKMALIFGKVTGDHDIREIEEMRASDLAFEYMKELVAEKERPLSENNLKELNRILLVRPFYKEALTEDGQPTRRLISIGEYKQHPNSVLLENGEMFHYASPTETPAKMSDLISWYRAEEEKGEMHPIELAARLHYGFVVIHPFDDGNGRISRLLVNYVLLKHGLPPVIINTDDKKNYLNALNKADTGNIGAFITYMSIQLIDALELKIKAAKGKDIEDDDDWKKKLNLFVKKLNVQEDLQILKNPATVDELLRKNILPFFVKVADELSYFDTLFIKKHYTLNNSNSSSFSTQEISEIPSMYTGRSDYFMNDIILEIAYYQFKKNGPTILNIVAFLYVTFENTQYIITTNMNSEKTENIKRIEKYYHQSISTEEFNQIVSAIANELLYILEVNTSK